MKPRVLFVDDDTALLETIQELMQHYAGDSWEIFAASDIAPALSLIQERHIDLIVVDIHMPLVDGMQLLKMLERRFPALLKVILTGDSTGACRAASLNHGADLYLEKPRSANGWQTIYATLNELVKFKAEEQGFRGELRQVGLQDVLQLECLARNSSILELVAGSERGLIYIREGTIVHAEIGDLTGVEAFFRLYTLTGGEFNLKPYAEPSQIDIVGTSWEGLMMEAAQMRDERPETPPPAPDEHEILEFSPIGAPVLEAFSPPAADPNQVLRPEVKEVLICSLQGDVLYEWQCTKTQSRISFLELVIQNSRKMAEGLPLGDFDRMEATGANRRMVAQLQPEHAFFVLTSLVPVIQTAPAESSAS